MLTFSDIKRSLANPITLGLTTGVDGRTELQYIPLTQEIVLTFGKTEKGRCSALDTDAVQGLLDEYNTEAHRIFPSTRTR